MNEARTCRAFVIPKLEQANWYKDPHDVIEQKTFTDGRIAVADRKVKRRPEKRADYLLKYTRDYTIAILEAKADYVCRVTSAIFKRWRVKATRPLSSQLHNCSPRE